MAKVKAGTTPQLLSTGPADVLAKCIRNHHVGLLKARIFMTPRHPPAFQFRSLVVCQQIGHTILRLSGIHTELPAVQSKPSPWHVRQRTDTENLLSIYMYEYLKVVFNKGSLAVGLSWYHVGKGCEPTLFNHIVVILQWILDASNLSQSFFTSCLCCLSFCSEHHDPFSVKGWRTAISGCQDAPGEYPAANFKPRTNQCQPEPETNWYKFHLRFATWHAPKFLSSIQSH